MLIYEIPVIVVPHQPGHENVSITRGYIRLPLASMIDEEGEMIDELVTPTQVKLENLIPVV
jgi:hypothetical protein